MTPRLPSAENGAPAGNIDVCQDWLIPEWERIHDRRPAVEMAEAQRVAHLVRDGGSHVVRMNQVDLDRDRLFPGLGKAKGRVWHLGRRDQYVRGAAVNRPALDANGGHPSRAGGGRIVGRDRAVGPVFDVVDRAAASDQSRRHQNQQGHKLRHAPSISRRRVARKLRRCHVEQRSATEQRSAAQVFSA